MNAFEQYEKSLNPSTNQASGSPSKQNPFELYEQEQNPESFGASSFRTAAQIPLGIAEATGSGMLAGLFQLLAAGETDLDVEDWQRVRKAYEDKGETFDEEAYERGREQALSYIPTVSNIAGAIENKTGIPLEPKTHAQKGLRFASMAGKAIPKPNPTAPKGYTFRGLNTGLPRPVLGAGVEGARELLMQMGIPEFAADLLSFGVVKPTSATSGIFKIGKEQKPSGLTTRRFEGIQKPTEVSPKTLAKINENAEREFRDITSNIIKEGPIKETYEALSKDVTFKKNAHEEFKKVESLSETLPQIFDSKNLKTELKTLAIKKKDSGLTPSEFDKSHNKFIKQFIEETPDRSFTAKEIVSQYRKNNKQLSEAYEPGQSFAYNRAKREALLDYNRLLAEMIEKEFPNSEFSNLFKETNKRWADISNSEAVSNYLDHLFKKGKPNFKNAHQIFEKDGMTVPFKKAMGEEGFAKFETLINDLLTQEQGYKLLKKAEDQGAKEFIKLASSYLVHPNVATAKAGWNVLKGGYNTIYNMVIDKPKLAVTWDRALNAAKRGDFKAAEKEFKAVKATEIANDAKEATRRETLKKFNEKKKTAPRDETIEVKPIAENAQQAASQAFDEYGLTSFMQEAVDNGYVKNIDEVGDYIRKSPTLTRKAEQIEKKLGKSIDEIINDLSGRKAKSNQVKPNSLKHADENIIVAQKENLPREYDDTSFRDNFMSQKTGQNVAEMNDLKIQLKKLKEMRDAIKGTSQESVKKRSPLTVKINELELQLHEDKSGLPKLSEDEVIAEMAKRYPKSKFAQPETKSKPKKTKKEKPPASLTKDKIQEVKRQDISKKGLKDQKQFIVNKLNDVLKNPSKYNSIDKILLEVPGDGTFKIVNNEKNIEKFLKNVEKKWPDKPLKLSRRELQQTKR